MAKMNYEQSVERLEEIVALLESGGLTLEESLKLFEEGSKLLTRCHTALQTAEQKITMMTAQEKGDAQE